MNSSTFGASAFLAASSPWDFLARWAKAIVRGGAGTVVPATPPVQRIGRHATVAHVGMRGVRIECLEGEVWITQDGDCRDVVLAVGQSVAVDRDSRVLVYALVEARTRISAAVA